MQFSVQRLIIPDSEDEDIRIQLLEKVLASWNLPSYKTTTPTELIEKLKSFQNELEPQQEPLRKALTPLSAAYLSASDQFDAKPNKPAYEAVFRAAELEYESAKKKFEDNVQQLEDLKKAEQVLLNLSTILSESRHYIPTLRNGDIWPWQNSSTNWFQHYQNPLKGAASAFAKSSLTAIHWYHVRFPMFSPQHPPPPLTLISELFADFVRDCDTSVSTFKEKSQIRSLLSSLNEEFENDCQRLTKFHEYLRPFLDLTNVSSSNHKQMKESKKEVDLALWISDPNHSEGSGSNEYPILFVEGKLHDVGNAGMQNNMCYHKWMNNLTSEFRDSSFAPCFLLEISKDAITISGIVCLDAPYCQTLASFSFLDGFEELPRFSQTERILKALKNAILKMSSFAQYSNVGSRKNFPMCLPSISLPNLEQLSLNEKSEIKQPEPIWKFSDHKLFHGKSLVMTAVVDKESTQHQAEKVVLKYVRNGYSTELHSILEKENLAPKLYFAKDINCRWKWICMQYLKDFACIENWKLKEKEIDISKFKKTALECLEKLLESLLKHNKVHGDLRSPNMLWNKDGKLAVIDFDWSESGKYPFNIALVHEWPEDMNYTYEIKHEHDRHWIKKMSDYINKEFK